MTDKEIKHEVNSLAFAIIISFWAAITAATIAYNKMDDRLKVLEQHISILERENE